MKIPTDKSVPAARVRDLGRIAALFLLGLGSLCCSVSEGALKLLISTDKSVHQSGESITVVITLMNPSTTPVTVNKRLRVQQPGLYVEIHDDLGNLVRWLPPPPPPPLRKDDFVVMGAGQEITAQTVQLERHLTNELETGRYSIRATYRNDDAGTRFGLQAWTGEVVSNTATFVVGDRSS